MAKKKSEIPLQKTLTWAALGVGLVLAGSELYKQLNRFSVKDKVILITGGSRGLGLALARELSSRGAILAICARSADQLELARQELSRNGANVMALAVDVTQQKEVATMVNDIARAFGKIDVIINNAGIIQVGPQDSMSIEDYEKAMQTNFWAPLYGMQAVIPHFMKQGGGHVVNITSIGGKIAIPHLLPYSASKFALVGLSEGMQAELKKYNIHVTTVIPNLMNTGSPRNITVKGDHEKEYGWFKTADAFPLISQDLELAAKKIVHALEVGDSETTLTATAKIATILKGFAPGWMNAILAITDKFLPENNSSGNERKKGYESESSFSKNPIAQLSDKSAKKNNED
jgi:short-subunit dehydrogenase